MTTKTKPSEVHTEGENLTYYSLYYIATSCYASTAILEKWGN